MKIYYSGAEIADQPQPDNDLSLGGFKSNTLVVPDIPGNIFDSISRLSKQRGIVTICGVFLVNDESDSISDLKLYYTYPPDYGNGEIKIEIAAVSAINNNQMEKINNSSSNPYYGNFVEALGIANEVTLIASLDAGDAIGLWIRRTVKPQTSPSCDQLYDAYKEIVPPTNLSNLNIPPAPVAPSNELPKVEKEKIIFNFSWV